MVFFLQNTPEPFCNRLLALSPFYSQRLIVKFWENNFSVAIKCIFQVYSTNGRQVGFKKSVYYYMYAPKNCAETLL